MLSLNVVPTPKILKEYIANSTQQMCRTIKLQEYFRYLPRFEKLPFTGKGYNSQDWRARVKHHRTAPVVIMNKWSVVDYGGHNVPLNIINPAG